MPQQTRRFWPRSHLLALILLPICIYLPERLGFVSSDPMMTTSLMVQNSSATTKGIIPGNPGWIDGCAGVFVEALGRLVARDWVHGIIPWWNPYSGVGMPLAGEYQPAAFFLPFVLFLGFSNGLLMMKCALQIIAGLSTYALLKQLRLDPRAALIGALLYAFNGTYAWASDGPSEPLAFLPLALYGVERARTGNWGWLALGLAYLLLAGFPETAFLLGLIALGLAGLRFFQTNSGKSRFALHILLGGLTAGLIAAPQLLAFLTFLPHADVGFHVGINNDTLPHQAWAMLLFPYINGPIFYGPELGAWYALGGYCGLVLPFMALCAIGGKKERGLRFLLLGIIIAVVGKQAGVPVLTQLVDLIPGAGHTVFYRLCEPMVESCLILLAAFTLDDMFRGIWRRKAVLLSAVTIIAVGVVAYLLDRPALEQLRSFSEGPVSSQCYATGSLIFGLFCLAGALGLCWYRKHPKTLGALVLSESLILFGFPLLSAYPEPPRPDQNLIAALREETGLQRFVTIGPVEPNYGAYLGIASINHNAIPTPKAWIQRLRQDFGSKVDSVTFNGSYPFTESGDAFLETFLARRPELFATLGVSALLVPPGHGLPSIAPYSLKDRQSGGLPLTPDASEIKVDISSWDKPSSRLTMLQLGTYGGHSDGLLVLSICSDSQCATGQTPLKQAKDNGLTAIELDGVIPSDARTMTLNLKDATTGVMIWSTVKDQITWPRIRFETDAVRETMIPVLQTPTGDLIRLKNPAPYFETEATCTLTPKDREMLSATCAEPTHLIRREVMLPGWKAEVNGTSVLPEMWDGLFERIPLPAGTSQIHFHFAPPGAPLGWIAVALGLILLGLGFRRTKKDGPL
ncbi:YfhO family protein [Gluconobacter frateurii]|uniref:YfhO family protein n=1 Tax=Gluconobacter frateurii TaxID=38308 RepID=UPI001F06682C|nr:YfhO family protein [Gluconobacter frateurii]UMM07610.1 YfhO family protein [Gluconobacter frateurii]